VLMVLLRLGAIVVGASVVGAVVVGVVVLAVIVVVVVLPTPPPHTDEQFTIVLLSRQVQFVDDKREPSLLL